MEGKKTNNACLHESYTHWNTNVSQICIWNVKSQGINS